MTRVYDVDWESVEKVRDAWQHVTMAAQGEVEKSPFSNSEISAKLAEVYRAMTGKQIA